jgi:hypothetical protein
MRKAALIAAILIALLNTTPGQATGIPTVDIANIMQNLARYLNELKEYAEILEMHAVEVAHYYETYKTYQQKLLEYQNYLSELEALKDQIDRKDWWAINEAIKRNLRRGQSLRKKYLDSADTQAANAEKNVDEMLGNYETVPMKEKEVSENMATLGIESDQLEKSAAQDWENYLLRKERMMDVADLEQRSKNRIEKTIPAHKHVLNKLKDKSSLATKQAIAAQGLTEMEQTEDLIEIENQILLNMESMEETAASQNAEMRQAEFERLKNFEPAKSYGSDRYGKL